MEGIPSIVAVTNAEVKHFAIIPLTKQPEIDVKEFGKAQLTHR
ncbi:hypothetical protein [Planctopirus limnophila]|nr:hypothetical protein [Planctopirus limnophila]